MYCWTKYLLEPVTPTRWKNHIIITIMILVKIIHTIFITLYRRRVLGDSRGGEGDASAGSDNIWGESGVYLGLYIWVVYLWGIFWGYILGYRWSCFSFPVNNRRKKSVDTCKEGCLGSAACSRPWTGWRIWRQGSCGVPMCTPPLPPYVCNISKR